ncbi:hypothetical protein JQC92_17320 [Shewanella sp. 202IG2-18]|uniref:hypothetical protein n=1 Tax=Parashewanella hymeniacidonis TaxID=2807618 RepID=UPI0019621BAA|nr:hypothetical protein [Parashewanella hymeniacidonis]MBM7073773.1 hypothetical protein [Parashewanella hymeniacidonis]
MIDINSTDDKNQNLLHLVLRSRNLSNSAKSKLITQLLGNGSSAFFRKDNEGVSPLMLVLNREYDALSVCRENVLTTLEALTPETLSHLQVDGIHFLNYMALHAEEYSPDAMALLCRHGAASHVHHVNEVEIAKDLANKCSPEEYVEYRLVLYDAILDHEQSIAEDKTDDVEFGHYQRMNSMGQIEETEDLQEEVGKPKVARSMSIEDYEQAILKANKESFGHKLVRAFKAIPDKIHDKALQYRARLDASYRPEEDTLGLLKYRAVHPVDRVVPIDVESRQHGFVPILIERKFDVERTSSEIEEMEIDQIADELSAPTTEVETRREKLEEKIERLHSAASTHSEASIKLQATSSEVNQRRQEVRDNYRRTRSHNKLSRSTSQNSDFSQPLSAKRRLDRNSLSRQMSHSLPKASMNFSPESSLNNLPSASSSPYSREMSYEDEVFESPVKKARARRVSFQPNVAMIREQEPSELNTDEIAAQKPVLRSPSRSTTSSVNESPQDEYVPDRNPLTGDWKNGAISKALMEMNRAMITPAYGHEVEHEQPEVKQRNNSTGAHEEKTLANGLFQVGASVAIPVACSSKCCSVVPIASKPENPEIEEQEDQYLTQIVAAKAELQSVVATEKQEGNLSKATDIGTYVSGLACAIRAYPTVDEGPKEAKLFIHGLSVGEQVIKLVKAMKEFDDETLTKNVESLSKLASEALDVAEVGVIALSALVGDEDMGALINTLPKGVTAAKQFKTSLVTIKDELVRLLSVFREMQDSKMFDKNAPADAKLADNALDFLKLSAHFTKELASVGRSLATASREILTLTGQAGTAAGQAVPGLSIFVSVLDIAERAVSLTQAVRSYAQMSEYKTTLKESFKDDSELSGVVDEDTNQTNKAELKRLAFESEYDDQVDTSTIDEAKRYDLVRGLKRVNEKRIKREAFKMTLDVANIAAAIAELSGAGAGAGLGISVTTAGVNIGAFTVRNVKQQYHDYKADEKSTEAKHAARLRQIEVMIGLLRTIEIPAEDDEYAQKTTSAQLEEVKQLFKAAGLPLSKFLKPGLKPDVRLQNLYDALKKRE